MLDGSHDDLIGDGLSLDVELLWEDVDDLVHDKAAVLVCGELEFFSVVLQDLGSAAGGYVLRKHLQELVEIRALEDLKAFLDELVGNAIDIETTHLAVILSDEVHVLAKLVGHFLGVLGHNLQTLLHDLAGVEVLDELVDGGVKAVEDDYAV